MCVFGCVWVGKQKGREKRLIRLKFGDKLSKRQECRLKLIEITCQWKTGVQVRISKAAADEAKYFYTDDDSVFVCVCVSDSM